MLFIKIKVLKDKDMRTTIILFTSSSDIQSSGRGLGGVLGGSITVFSSSPCFFFFFFLFLAFRHCCGKDDAFAGPKRRENLNTWPGRNSGNRSVTVLPSWVVSLPSLVNSSEIQWEEEVVNIAREKSKTNSYCEIRFKQ